MSGKLAEYKSYEKTRKLQQAVESQFSLIPTLQRLDADPNLQGESITIAFLDSGFYAHPDLIQPETRILKYIDITNPEDGDRQLYKAANQSWHGTQTCVSATGNGYLSDGHYRGIAAKAKLVLVKVGSKKGIEPENIAAGLRWVLENKDKYNIRIVNISLGGDEDIPYLDSEVDVAAEAVVAAGVVVVVAAGNSGCTDRPNLTPPGNSPSVITVGGYDDNNRPGGSGHKTLCDELPTMYCSNFGYTADGNLKPELIAPAIWVPAPILPTTKQAKRAVALWELFHTPRHLLNKRVRELWEVADLPEKLHSRTPPIILKHLSEKIAEDKLLTPYYQHVDGTSFAAPIVSSIVAQMLEANPKLTPDMVKQILISTAHRVPYFPLLRQGFGILDARNAVAEARKEHAEIHYKVIPSPIIEHGGLVFTYHNAQASSIHLAGDFNKWSTTKTPMKKLKPGLWRVSLPCPEPGVYRYKYLIDGKTWIDDPGNGKREPDGFKGFNSIVVISD
ncbi:MAG: S8 family serine peptidase [Blastocatellia bacterium]|nr:S8 family serine peptidase [Blastocatellia bacterium]